MRICVIGNPNSVHVRRWVADLAERGEDVHLIGNETARHPLPERIISYDLTEYASVQRVRFPVWVVILRRLLRKIGPAVLHAHGAGGPGWLATASRFHPRIVTAHGSELMQYDRLSWIMRFLTRRTITTADHLVCVSKVLRDRAIQLGASASATSTIYLGVDLNTFRPVARDEVRRVRENLGLNGGPLVLSLRAMRDLYRPLDILEAVSRVLEQVPDAILIVFTYGRDERVLARFSARARALGIEHAVRYVDELASDIEIAQYVTITDAVVSMASSDGLGLSLVEAMGCGRVVIAGDTPAAREVVQHGCNGLVVDLGDVDALSNSIARVLLDSELRKRLGQGALATARDRFDRRKWMDVMSAFYTRVAAS